MRITLHREQVAIAELLSKSEKEIELLENKRKAIQAQKKYLLNNLMTGKLRVPEKEVK